MTRTFAIGEFTAETDSMYQAVLAAQAAGVAVVSSGVSTDHVDATCRGVLAERHPRGGVRARQPVTASAWRFTRQPFLGKSNPTVLRADQVVTVEPGVYREGLGGRANRGLGDRHPRRLSADHPQSERTGA